jgi:hypothetical protein
VLKRRTSVFVGAGGRESGSVGYGLWVRVWYVQQ